MITEFKSYEKIHFLFLIRMIICSPEGDYEKCHDRLSLKANQLLGIQHWKVGNTRKLGRNVCLAHNRKIKCELWDFIGITRQKLNLPTRLQPISTSQPSHPEINRRSFLTSVERSSSVIASRTLLQKGHASVQKEHSILIWKSQS
jgi:hypothetical protein